MTETSHALLMRTLLTRYHELRARLSRRLGSPDLAAEALHEVWLKLNAREELPAIGKPEAYLFNAAVYTARNFQRTSLRQRLDPADIAEFASIPDDSPDPARIAAARVELEAIEAALAELSPRQQAVFHESFLGDATQQELANRFDVTVRTIQSDLSHALKHCVRRARKRISFVPKRNGVTEK